MFKKIVVTGILAMMAGSAHAEPKFMFRYVNGGAALQTTTPEPEPEVPVTPEPPKNTILQISKGTLGHFDANANGIVDAGDTITASFPIRNSGNYAATGIGGNMSFVLNSPYGIYFNTDIQMNCPSILAAKANGTCSASLHITSNMVPNSGRSDYAFRAWFSNFSFENMQDMTGETDTDSLPIGSQMLVEIAGYPDVNFGFRDFKIGETTIISFNLDTANGEPFSDYAFDVRIPELNAVVQADCGDTSTPAWSGRCTASFALNNAQRTKFYENWPENYSLSYEIIQREMGGYPVQKRLASNGMASGDTPYGYEMPQISGFNVLAGNTIDDSIIIIGSISNNSDDYLRGVRFDVDLGLDVVIADFCPAVNKMLPHQKNVSCNTMPIRLTEAQKAKLRGFFGENGTGELHPRLLDQDGVTVGGAPSFNIRMR
ncbi:hypothetical protein ACTOV4_10150 [Brucella sp. C7-11G]